MKRVKLAIGWLIFIGLPLAGWGLDDVAGFLRDPARSAYVIAMFVLQIVVILRFPNSGSSGARDVPRSEHVRHPRYLGIIMFALGIALVFRSWIGVALAAALTIVLLVRVRREEALMRTTFGSEWDEYKRRSWRLIPLLY